MIFLKKKQSLDEAQIDYLVSPPVNKNLTKEQKKTLKIISRGSELLYQDLLRDTTERIELIIELYYQRKPIIDDLNTHGIHIKELDALEFSKLNEGTYKKAILVLVEWLKKKTISNHAVESIIDVLIENPVAKPYSLDSIIDIYKKNKDKNIPDKSGFLPPLFISIGNGLIRWVDDNYADIILDLLNEKKLRHDSFLLASTANFKEPENIKKAIKILVEEFQQPELNNARLVLLINTLRKLKARETKELISPFTEFPKHYRRTKKMTTEKSHFVSDAEVRSVAKKAIAAFENLQRLKRP